MGSGEKMTEQTKHLIKNWIISKDTIELLGFWEQINNPGSNVVEFDQFRNQAGSNYFVFKHIGADRGGYWEVAGG